VTKEEGAEQINLGRHTSRTRIALKGAALNLWAWQEEGGERIGKWSRPDREKTIALQINLQKDLKDEITRERVDGTGRKSGWSLLGVGQE